MNDIQFDGYFLSYRTDKGILIQKPITGSSIHLSVIHPVTKKRVKRYELIPHDLLPLKNTQNKKYFVVPTGFDLSYGYYSNHRASVNHIIEFFNPVSEQVEKKVFASCNDLCDATGIKPSVVYQGFYVSQKNKNTSEDGKYLKFTIAPYTIYKENIHNLKANSYKMDRLYSVTDTTTDKEITASSVTELSKLTGLTLHAIYSRLKPNPTNKPLKGYTNLKVSFKTE
jgi:hypothetical protein